MNRALNPIAWLVLALAALWTTLDAQHPQDNRPSFSETRGGGFDAPDFNLKDLYGRTHTARDHRGKVLLLYFMGHD